MPPAGTGQLTSRPFREGSCVVCGGRSQSRPLAAEVPSSPAVPGGVVCRRRDAHILPGARENVSCFSCLFSAGPRPQPARPVCWFSHAAVHLPWECFDFF